MAKGKSGSGKTYTSQGVHRSLSRATRSAMRADKTPAQRLIDKQNAWLKGANPWITIANPNREQTNRRFIRVRMNDMMHGTAKDLAKRMVMKS